MRDYFKSRNFKILAAVVLVLLGFLLQSIRTGDASTLLADIAGAITRPLQQVTASVSHSVGGFFGNILGAKRIAEENEQLREENRKLLQQMIEFEAYRSQNEQYKQYLGLKEQNPDYDFVPANVTARDHNDRFGSFIIDKGSADEIAPRDVVITPDGLVGIISEVGLTTSKVITILDPSLNVGAMDIRTRETGIVNGLITLAAKGRCRMNYLPRESQAAQGDVLVTTGSDAQSLFPRNLVIGTIDSLAPEASGLSLYAAVTPAADILGATEVFVITYFLGQGE